MKHLYYGSVLAMIITYIWVKLFGSIIDIPYGVMITYFVLRMISRKNNFWDIKCVCYFAVGIITFIDESKATSLVAVVAFIEAVDLVFENLMKRPESKIYRFFKGLYVAVFGYRFV